MMYAFPSNYQDGGSRFANRLLNALKHNNPQIQAHVVAPQRLGAAPRRPFLQLVVAAELLWGLLKLRPDVVHVHEHPVVLAAAIAYRALRLGSTRVVHTVHVEPTTRRGAWKRLILGWLMERCSVVTSVSADTARRLADIATPSPRKVMVIHGGAEVLERTLDDPAVECFRSSIGLTTGPVLCQIGLNFPRKVEGALRLMDAVRLVREQFPGVHLILVGDGPLRRSVEEKCREMGMTNSTTIAGYLDDVSLPLALTDIYCHITFQDACPLSVLEAMRCGKPLIAARVGGIPELITDGVDGLLIDPDSSIGIAKAITGLLRDLHRARALGSSAKQTAMTRFSWDRVAAEFSVAYGLAADA